MKDLARGWGGNSLSRMPVFRVKEPGANSLLLDSNKQKKDAIGDFEYGSRELRHLWISFDKDALTPEMQG